MSLKVIIIAHGQGIAAFRRHEPFWRAHNAPIDIICPIDDQIEAGGMFTHAEGLAQRAGTESIQRLKSLFWNLEHNHGDWTRCVIYEYDSFSLDAKLPEGRGLHGNVMLNRESPKFLAHRYANPPWCFDRESFDAMHAVSKEFPLYEEGEADRWISSLAELAGVPLFDYSPKGFSKGTISQQKKDIRKLQVAIYQGATMLHGIKHEWVLSAAKQFYDERHLPHAKEIAAWGKV